MPDHRDFYNRDGNILRVKPVADGFVEVELDFVAARREDALLYSITALYLAFRVKRDLSYVFSSHTFQRVVMRAADLTAEARTGLAEAVVLVRARSGVLFGRADQFFRGKKDRGLVTTCTVAELTPYRKTELEARTFLEAVARALG